MSTNFNNYAFAPANPANGAFEITPNDNADLPQTTRSLFVGGAGNVNATLRDGSSATFICQAGQELGIMVVKIAATGTTATGLVGLV